MDDQKSKEKGKKTRGPKRENDSKKAVKLARMPGSKTDDETKTSAQKTKARMERAKKKAFELEKDNKSKLVAYFSGGDWYKIGGTSALVYAHMIAPRLGISVNVRPDADLECKFVEGIVSIRSIGELAENLKKLGILIESQDDDIAVFNLGFKVSDAELDAIRSVRRERIEQMNKIIEADKTYAGLVTAERKVAVFLRSKMLKANTCDRDMIMAELAHKAVTACASILAISAKNDDMAIETLAKVYKDNRQIQLYSMILMDMGILTDIDTLRLQLDLSDANRLIKAKLKKLGAKVK